MGNVMSWQTVSDAVLCAAGPVSSIIAAQYGRNSWLTFEIASSIGFGLLLILKPDLMISSLTETKMTSFHYFLCAIFGLQSVNIVMYALLSKDSQDKSALVGHHWSRIIEHSLIALNSVFSYYEGNHWNQKNIWFGATFALTHLAGNIYFLAKTPKQQSESKKYDLAGVIGKVDFYLSLMSGIIFYALPETVNLALGGPGTIDESYRMLTRSTGAFLIGTSMAAFFCSDLKSNEDKRKFMLSRIYGNVVESGVLLMSYFMGTCSLRTMVGLTAINIGYYMPFIYGYMNTPAIESKKIN